MSFEPPSNSDIDLDLNQFYTRNLPTVTSSLSDHLSAIDVTQLIALIKYDSLDPTQSTRRLLNPSKYNMSLPAHVTPKRKRDEEDNITLSPLKFSFDSS